MQKKIVSRRAGAKQHPANTANTLVGCDSTPQQTVEASSEALATVSGSGNGAIPATPENCTGESSAPQPNQVPVRAGEPDIGETKPTGGTGNGADPATPKHKVTAQSRLSPEQQKRKADLEEIIDGGLNTWIEVCCAMAEIKASALYHPYDTFHEYCRERFKFAKSTCYAYANAGHSFQLIESSGEDCLPRNEAQLRPLLDLEDDQVIKVWSDAVKLGGNGGLTESIVRKAREMLIGKPVRNIDPIKQTRVLKKSIRDAWDKYPAGERPNLDGGDRNDNSGKSDKGNVGEFLKKQCPPASAAILVKRWCEECEQIKESATAFADLEDAQRQGVIKQLVELSRATKGLARELIQEKWGRVRKDYEIHTAEVGDFVVRRTLAEHYKVENIGYWAERGGYFCECQDLPLFGVCDKLAKPLPSEKDFPAIFEAWVKSETRTLPYRTGKSLQTAKPGEVVNWVEIIKLYGEEAQESLDKHVSDLGPYESVEGQPADQARRAGGGSRFTWGQCCCEVLPALVLTNIENSTLFCF